MRTIQDVRKVLNELDKISGFDSTGVEVVRSRQTKTLASFSFRLRPVVEPVQFKISKTVLCLNEENFREIIKHEYAHFMATVVHNENCYHDYRFIEMCKKIGASFTEPRVTNDDIQEVTKRLAKHRILCKCGFEQSFSRMCETIRWAKKGYCKCPKCGNSELQHIERK